MSSTPATPMSLTTQLLKRLPTLSGPLMIECLQSVTSSSSPVRTLTAVAVQQQKSSGMKTHASDAQKQMHHNTT